MYLLNVKKLVRKHLTLGLGQDTLGHQSKDIFSDELSTSACNTTKQEQKYTSSLAIACSCTGIIVLTHGRFPRCVLIPKEHGTALALHPTHLCNHISILPWYNKVLTCQ